MKTLTKLLTIGFLASLSCKNDSPKQSTETTTNPMNDEITNTTNYKESGNFDDDPYDIEKASDSVNENWNLNDPERQQKLYDEFNMTQSQIQKYESALKDWWNSDEDAPYEKISANERIKKEDEILKKILDESQYHRYKEWADANDNR